MFSVFHKKHFLKDYLDGLIDIHNHILPGIDDGAATIKDSIALIKAFGELGITDFIATPHIMNDFYPNTPETIRKALADLHVGLKEEGLSEKVSIRPAAEYMMDQSFSELMEKEELLTLKEKFVLVEMSYFQAPINLNSILFQLQSKGYKPVLAHPERYPYFHSKTLDAYKNLKGRGCLFQMNLLSLVGHYGRNMQEIALRLLDSKMIDFIGSDTHQIRHLDKLSQMKLPKTTIEKLKPILQNTSDTFSPSPSRTFS